MSDGVGRFPIERSSVVNFESRPRNDKTSGGPTGRIYLSKFKDNAGRDMSLICFTGSAGEGTGMISLDFFFEHRSFSKLFYLERFIVLK